MNKTKKSIINKLLVVLICIVMAFSLTSCAKEQEEKSVEEKTEEREEAIEELVDEYAQLDAEIKKASDAVLDTLSQGGDKVIISKTFEMASVGDLIYTLVGIRNDMPDAQNFNIEIKFKDAKDQMRNPLTGDEKRMNEWFYANNDFGPFSIEGSSIKVVPIYFKVREQSALNTDTVKGSYNFNIQVNYEQSRNSFREYSGIMKYAIGVQ